MFIICILNQRMLSWHCTPVSYTASWFSTALALIKYWLHSLFMSAVLAFYICWVHKLNIFWTPFGNFLHKFKDSFSNLCCLPELLNILVTLNWISCKIIKEQNATGVLLCFSWLLKSSVIWRNIDKDYINYQFFANALSHWSWRTCLHCVME